MGRGGAHGICASTLQVVKSKLATRPIVCERREGEGETKCLFKKSHSPTSNTLYTHTHTHTHTPFLFPSTQPHPPPYNVTELTVKMALFTGGQDWLADPTDVANLIPMIKDVIFYHKNISYYDHLDFIWGLDAATQVYSEIITQIRNML